MQTPLVPTVLQFPVLSIQFPPLRVKLGLHALQVALILLLQFIAPVHLEFFSTVPNPHEIHLVSSEGSYARQAKLSLMHCPVLEIVKVAWHAKH